MEFFSNEYLYPKKLQFAAYGQFVLVFVISGYAVMTSVLDTDTPD